MRLIERFLGGGGKQFFVAGRIGGAKIIDTFNKANAEIVGPNPVDNGKLHLRFIIPETNCQLQILNVEGQVIYSEEMADANITATRDIDVSAYSSGVYCVRLVSKTAIMTRKLVIR